MIEIGRSKSIVEKSKFFGYLFKIKDGGDIQKLVELMEFEYPKACHICHGAIFNKEEIFKNDSEVGNPGKILLNLLNNNDLNSHALIVVRIYGGVKLGPAGVGKAFRNSGKEAILSIGK